MDFQSKSLFDDFRREEFCPPFAADATLRTLFCADDLKTPMLSRCCMLPECEP